MKANKRTPAWPYFGLLACLFALTVAAPRAWQRLALREIRDTPSAASPQCGAAMPAQASPSPYTAPTARQTVIPPLTSEPSGEMTPAAVLAEEAATSTPGAELFALLSAFAAAVDAPRSDREQPQAVAPPPSFESAFLPPLADDLALAPTRHSAESHLREGLSRPTGPANSAGRQANPPWPVPAALQAQLDGLVDQGIATDWCNRLRRELSNLAHLESAEGRSAQSALQSLGDLAREGQQIVESVDSAKARAQLERALAALHRRLTIWEAIQSPESQAQPVAAASAGAHERLIASLDKIDSLTGTRPEGQSWREYLLYDELREIAEAEHAAAETAQSVSARVLARLDRAGRAARYRQFLSAEPFAELTRALGPLASQGVDRAELLSDLERYESEGRSSDAEQIARKIQWLAWSDGVADRALSERLTREYALPNLRIALTEPMINRIVRQQTIQREAVHDNILGADVRGYSVSLTNVQVKLIPDEQHVRLKLEAAGTVTSNTSARSGPAQLRSEGRSRFSARKVFIYGPTGFQSLPSEAEADNLQDSLVDVQTDLDGLPLFGSLARRMAQTQHEDSRDSVRRIVERKVANRARAQLDREVQAKIRQLQTTFERRIAESLDRLAIQPDPIEYSTTADRVTMQWRLAAGHQLAAHTPRIWAPHDSQISLQIHQTAINNALDRLDLNGRTMSPAETYRWIAHKLGKSEPDLPEDLPEDAQITFAARDAVQVRCDDDRIELIISLAELSQGKRRWRNFSAQAQFRPETDGVHIRLIRDSAIHLGGETLHGKPQVLLRGIFSKLMPRDRLWELLPKAWAEDQRLRGLELTQCDIVDGWIGIALGPPREPLEARHNNGRRAR